MKRILVTAGLLMLGVTAASAEPYGEWRRGHHPYAERHHEACQYKARKVWEYERRARADGRITRDERADIITLRRDLNRNCGGYRYH